VDLLDRLCVALAHPGVRGIVGTPDVIDDLLLLGVLDDKAVFASMNRGGLARASWEIDDRFTAYDAPTIATMGFEGGKMRLRIDLENPATATMLEAAGKAVCDLAARELVALVEPSIASTVDGRVTTVATAEATTLAATIAAGLGATSAYTWLGLPVVPEMERVVAATTLPVLLLGDEAAIDQEAAFERWRAALTLPTVVGLVVGPSLLYPRDDDVAASISAAARLLPSQVQ
jgi:hypothetical protein